MSEPILARVKQTPPRLLIGPTNTVGQGSTWASIARTHLGVEAEVWKAKLGDEPYPYQVERVLQPEIRDAQERAALVKEIGTRFTHVINESGQPFGSARSMRRVIQEAYARRLRGVRTAQLFHGSDIRLPSMHRAGNPDSPFHQSNDGLTEKLERLVSARRSRLRFWLGTTFITTLDLHAYVSRATWLPVVIAPGWLAPAPPIDTATPRPKVLHMWTRRAFSQSEAIDQICSALHAEGLIEYQSVAGIPPEEVRAQVLWADIVIDKVGFGATGVFASEALATGRLVIGAVGDRTRKILPEHPVIDATTKTFEGVLRTLVADRSTWAARATAGQAFARKYHDGRYSAGVLAKWMGVPVKQP
jgi:hypothetical protein